MEKQSITYGIIGLLLGIIITWAVATSAVNNQNTSMMNMMGMHKGATTMMDHDEMMNRGGDMSDMSMNDMSDELRGIKGDEFDKKFIASMIAHHQGAIDMANAAKNQAKHQEIKDMSDEIISAQTTEINQMKEWQKEWGY